MSSWPYPPFEPNKSNTSGIPGPVVPRGAPGADSTVPGPQGPPGANSTVPGPAGTAGRDGIDAEEALTTVYVIGFAASRYVAYKGPTVDASAQVSGLEAVSDVQVATAVPPACSVVTTSRRKGRPYLTFAQSAGRNMLALPFALDSRDVAVFIVYRLAAQKSAPNTFSNALVGGDRQGFCPRGIEFGGAGSSLVISGVFPSDYVTVGPDSIGSRPKLTATDYPALRDTGNPCAVCVQWVWTSPAGASNAWVNGAKMGTFSGNILAAGTNGTALGDFSTNYSTYTLTGDVYELIVMDCPPGRSYTRTTGGLTDAYTALVFERLRQRWAFPYAALTPAPDAATLYLKGPQGEVGPPSTVPGPTGPAGKDGKDAATDSATLVLYGSPSVVNGVVALTWSTAVMHQAVETLTSFPTNYTPQRTREPRVDFGSYFAEAGAPPSQRIACRVSITADGPIGELILRIVDASGRSPPTAPTVKYSYPFTGITTSGAVREFLFTMGATPNWTAVGFWLDVQDAPDDVKFTAITFTAEFRDWVPATTTWQTYDVPSLPYSRQVVAFGGD